MVEDNPDHAEMTVRALRKGRIANNIRVVGDGAEALEFLFAESHGPVRVPRVILLDIQLTGIDGIEVLRRIKGDPRTRDIPVVMLTSSHEENDLRVCHELGVHSYIVKPVDFQEFSDAVRALGLYTVGGESAAAFFKLGAANYLVQDRMERLGEAVSRALGHTPPRRE